MNARYQRQIILPGFGETAQAKLANAKVLVVGVGGLGCPALQYLAAAGIGTIGLVDDDVVSLNNLHRQILFGVEDIGNPKVVTAVKKLQSANPEIQLIGINEKLTNSNALSVFREFDFVIDGTDNFISRYLINDACVLLNKPLIYGAVAQFEGQVAVFNVADNEGKKTNYRHLFPVAPKPGEVPNCADAGVIGVLPGIIGTMQAAEIIKLITGIGTPLINQVLTYNFLNHQTYTFRLNGNDINGFPETEAAFSVFDYNWFCHIQKDVQEVNTETLRSWMLAAPVTIIDVRELNEEPKIIHTSVRQMPFSVFPEMIQEITDDRLIFICQTGFRSRKAAGMLSDFRGGPAGIYSLKGGLTAADFLFREGL